MSETGPAARSPTQRILHETARFAALQAFGAVLGWVAQIALARLLDRRDFGVFGICTFYIGLGQLLGDGGLGATLLRRKGDVHHDEYRATLTALFALALSFSLALFIGAPWIARVNGFTANETLALRVMAPLYLVGALRIVPYVRLERELLFSVVARVELFSSLMRHALAIALAAAVGSVWALVVSHLVGAFMQLALAYRASPGWVGFGWSWRVFRPLIAYGSKVQALNLLGYFKDNMSRAMLGGFVGPTAVGVYDFGVGYIQVPVVAVNKLARVQLPVYARFDATDPALYAAFRGAVRTAVLAGIPLLGALTLAAEWAIPFIYGTQWTVALPVVWGLLVNMICGLVLSPLFTLLQGQGRAGLAIVIFGAWTTATWILAIVSLLVVPGSLGLVAGAQSFATVFVTAYLFAWASRQLRTNATSGLWVPISCGALALASGFGVRMVASGVLSHPLLAAVVFLLIYIATLMLLEGRIVRAEIKAIWQGLRGKPRAAESHASES